MDLDTSFSYIVACIIVAVICAFIKLSLLIIYIVLYRKSRNKNNIYAQRRRSSTIADNGNSNRCLSMDVSLDILTILYVLISTISSTCTAIYYFGPFFEYISCTFYINCQAVFWVFYTYFKWVILLLRLYKVYGKTAKSKLYHRYTITTVIVILGMYAMFTIITFIMNQSATLTRLKFLYGCNWTSVGWEQPSIALLDVIISIICLYLFYKPLKMVLNRRKETDPDNLNAFHSMKFKQIILKYSVLTYLCSITTILVTIMIILISSAKLLIIDVTINAICLMGMSRVYDALFNKFCCCFIKCIMDAPNHQKENEIQLDN